MQKYKIELHYSILQTRSNVCETFIMFVELCSKLFNTVPVFIIFQRDSDKR